jgi:hypothetical protein
MVRFPPRATLPSALIPLPVLRVIDELTRSELAIEEPRASLEYRIPEARSALEIVPSSMSLEVIEEPTFNIE